MASRTEKRLPARHGRAARQPRHHRRGDGPTRSSLPTAVRGQAAAIAIAAVDWLANFLLIEIFPVWQNAISLAGVLVCFAALCAAAIAFVFWFLPETKGLPVEEIVRVFERQKGTLQPVNAVQH